MEPIDRPNLYKLLSKDIKKTDTVLDVGFGNLFDLVDFEDSEFKRLLGLDKDSSQPFARYLIIKKLKFTVELLRYFNKRFTLRAVDFRQFDFAPDQYSLIICNKVLHFYADDQKMKFLEVFYHALQPEGLLYVKLNHNRHQNNTDPLAMVEVEPNVFKNIGVPTDIRYLVDPERFLEHIRASYSILDQYSVIDEKTVSFVMTKAGPIPHQ